MFLSVLKTCGVVSSHSKSFPFGGVLGALTGLVGSIQAVETLKLILEIGDSLVSRLLLIDGLAMDFRTVKLRRNPSCPLCGDTPTVTELIDYEIFCGLPSRNGDH